MHSILFVYLFSRYNWLSKLKPAMQQREGKSTPRVSCQSSNALHTSEALSSELACLEESHGESAIQVVPEVYTLHDNESFEYNNNKEGESVSDDSSVCQKMNSFTSDHERNMVITFSKGSLIEKKEGLLLGNASSKQMVANSSDGVSQKPSQPAAPSPLDTLAPPDEDTCSSATDYDSSCIYDKNKKSVCGSIVKGVVVLSLVVCLLCSMHQPQIVHPHSHKNTTGQESQECSKETKRSADKVAEDNMIHFCLPSEEPDIPHMHHQCPATDPSIQQCVAKEFDDSFWSPFGEVDENVCLTDRGVHHSPEAPFRDLTPGYDIPKYKERMDSSFFGSIHSLPMDKISLSVPSLKKKKRKKKLRHKSKQRTSGATVEISKPTPLPSYGTSTRFSAVYLFQLLVLLCIAVPVSVPLQEHALLSDKANKPPSDRTGLANYATFTNYQVIETWTFVEVVIIGLTLLIYVHRQIIQYYIVRFWPDCQQWLVDAFQRFRRRSCFYLQNTLIPACTRLGASAGMLVIKSLTVAQRVVKKVLKKVFFFTISCLVSVIKLIYHGIAGQLRWMQVQQAELSEPRQHHNDSDSRPQQPVSELCEQLIYQEQAKQPQPGTSSDHTANGYDQHQVTNASLHNRNFANSAQNPLEEASQEVVDDFSASCSHVYPSTLDDNGVSPPYREHTVELPSPDESASLPHRHSGTQKEGSQCSTAGTCMGIHLEAEPCEPITCSDPSSSGELVCSKFFQMRDRNGFQNGEFVCPFQGAALNNFTTHENFAELSTIVPQEVTAEIPMDSPTKLLSFNTSMNYNLKKLQCVQMAKESLLPPNRCPINVDCIMMRESLGHNATSYTVVLSEANREAIQLQDTPCLVCLCRQGHQ